MRAARFPLGAILTIAILTVTAAASPHILQDGIEQRVSGLEARVTLLEQQIAELQRDDMAAPGTPATTPEATTADVTTTAHTLRGTFTVYVKLGHEETVGTPCDGGASRNVETGSRITIYNSSHQVVATTMVHSGTYSHKTTTDDAGNVIDYTVCVLPFSVPHLPDSAFYEVTVSGLSGSLTFSRHELEGMGWILRLGDE